jgi:hypothetical protein
MMLHAGSTPFSRRSEAAFTGTCEISLRRAVVPYRDPSELALPGGRIGDLGLGLVLENSDASRSRVLDLGSGEVRFPDLSGPLVLLGWIFPRLFRDLTHRLEEPVEAREVARLTRPVALRLVAEAGFTPLTRPLHLRIGFRDLCQDLDLHDETAIRLSPPGAGPVRCHLDYDESVLVFRSGRIGPLPELDEALGDAFPSRRLLRRIRDHGPRTQEYHLVLPVARSLSEVRHEMGRLRRGFLHLLARFESDRYRALREATAAFGERDSLAPLAAGSPGDGGVRDERVRPTRSRLEPAHSQLARRGIH